MKPFTPLDLAIFEAIFAEGGAARRDGVEAIPYDKIDQPFHYRAWLRGYQAVDAEITQAPDPARHR